MGARMAYRLGQRFGDYSLISFLGRGSFGDVYLGEHVRDKTQAAVKVLKPQLTVDELKQFINEASINFRLKHPHIVQLRDFGIAMEDIPFLVMDYAPNGTLLQRHPKGAIVSPATFIGYIKQIAEALQYAHDQRRIHRDIKPENILLGSNNEVLLSDFGIATIVQSTYTDKQNVAGTIPYMAPEQIQGKPCSASDQYALGIIVYEWICGTRPFHGSWAEIAMQHLSISPPSICDSVPEISFEVEQVVLKALAKDPKQRFESVQAFAHALDWAYQPIAISYLGEVTLTHQVGKKCMPVTGRSQVAYVLLEVKPIKLMAQEPLPFNFSLVLDNSSSMKGAKLRNVKEAVKMMIDRLEPTDYLSVVIFDDTSQVIIPSMQANDKPGMKAAIDQIYVRNVDGQTMRFMSLGMINGLNELRRWNIPNAINRMILLTDGFTYGDADRCCQLARDAQAAGISIYPLGLGLDWDENLLDTIGELSGGMPAELIRNPADAMAVFEQQLQSRVAVVLHNATLTLRLPQGVTPKKPVTALPTLQNLDPAVFAD